MRRAIFVIAMVTTVCFGEQLSAQELSTDVFSSEEELQEALREGEISYDQFLILIELIAHGIDSTESYLFDRVPNLLHVDRTSAVDSSRLTPLQQEQLEPYGQEVGGRGRPRLSIRYRYFQEMRRPDQHGHRLTTKFRLNQHWTAAAQVFREVSGNERFASRSIRYENPFGILKKLTIGNFNARLGLGTIYGYRGKIVNYANRLDLESLSYPDYGGFNGLQAVLERGDYGLELVTTMARDQTSTDSSHSIQSFGGMLQFRKSQALSPALIAGVSRLKNRGTAQVTNDLKLGLYLRERHEGGLVSLEITKQINAGRPSSALVVEGLQNFLGATVKYAGWSYGQGFLNLTSGSKGASLSHQLVDSLTGFAVSDRLSGQRGGLLKSILPLSEKWELTSSAIFGDRKNNRSRIELLGSLRRIWSRELSLRADFSSRRRQSEAGSADIATEQRSRLEVRFNMGEVRTRAYIAYTARDSATDFWSLYGRVRLPVRMIGTVDLSLNIGRIVGGKVEYLYFYLKHDQELSDRMKLTMKLADSYRSTRADKHEPVITLEIMVAI